MSGLSRIRFTTKALFFVTTISALWLFAWKYDAMKIALWINTIVCSALLIGRLIVQNRRK